MYKTNIYQDRLGTNIGKAALKKIVFLQAASAASSSTAEAAEDEELRVQGGSAGAHMVLAPCDASQPEQLWQLGATSTSGGMTTVKSMAGSKACWEINGCGAKKRLVWSRFSI